MSAPRFLRRAARRLRRLQQVLSRKATGSNGRKKAVVKLARAHARVADTRRDWQDKLSTSIIRDNQAVYVEDLCVVGLGRTRLAKSVHDAGWAAFTAMLEYKAARDRRTFTRVDRFFPSTRLCSDCGRINDKMGLSVRSWVCPCGPTHDRDHNAAKNVLAAGRADNSNDRGAHVRPGIRAGSAQGSGNPPGRSVFHAQRGGNLRPLGRRDRQSHPPSKRTAIGRASGWTGTVTGASVGGSVYSSTNVRD